MRALGALVLALAAVIASAPAQAAGASASGSAVATVIEPLSVRQTDDLDFGMVASSSAQPGSVTIAGRAGAPQVAYAGGASQICGAGGCTPPHPAGFVVSGEAGHGYAIAVPATLTISGIADGGGAAPALVVEALAIASLSRPDAGAAGMLGADGTDSFVVGGRLELPAQLQPARYRASFPVVVTYN